MTKTVVICGKLFDGVSGGLRERMEMRQSWQAI